MPLRRRSFAVLALAALTTLSPALARPRPARSQPATARQIHVHPTHLLDLLLDRFAQIQAKLLGSTKDSSSTLGPDGALTDTGSTLDPDGAK